LRKKKENNLTLSYKLKSDKKKGKKLQDSEERGYEEGVVRKGRGGSLTDLKGWKAL